MAARPPSPSVLRARSNATTTSGDSRLIIVNLHVAGIRRPLRALLDSGATNNFFRESCVSMLPPSIQVHEGPGQVVVKLADGKPRRVSRREVSLPYTFDGFRSSDNFLVIEMNYEFDCFLDIALLARYKPQIYWLTRSVRRRSKFASAKCLPISWCLQVIGPTLQPWIVNPRRRRCTERAMALSVLLVLFFWTQVTETPRFTARRTTRTTRSNRGSCASTTRLNRGSRT